MRSSPESTRGARTDCRSCSDGSTVAVVIASLKASVVQGQKGKGKMAGETILRSPLLQQTTRRRFLQATVATAGASGLPSFAAGAPVEGGLDGFQVARRHQIVRDLPTPDYFEGMLLGNGDVGLCATVRPDALGLHLSKLDVWDIRVSEDHARYVLPFAEVLKLWEEASAEAKRRGKPDMEGIEYETRAFREYYGKVIASYSKPWPRPWPCGTVWIHWDSRWVKLTNETLDPSNGELTIHLEQASRGEARRRLRLTCFVDWETGLLSVSTDGPAPFLSVAYYPYGEGKPQPIELGLGIMSNDAEAALPVGELTARGAGGPGEIIFKQRFPATAPTKDTPHPPPSEKDGNFALYGLLEGSWTVVNTPGDAAPASPGQGVTLRPDRFQPFRLDLLLSTHRDGPDNVARTSQEVPRLSQIPVADLQRKSETHWKEFWSRSAVEFEDKELERIWYHNQYFLACCLREGKLCPGLYGNWFSDKIGTAWHDDYHMDYNAQQVFWGVFSSNHADQHFPYIEVVEKLLPMSEKYAKEEFGLPGAYFPHVAFPIPSLVVPFPVPSMGYQVCETPWTVQSLWWHYLYTLDQDLLSRVYPPLRAAVRFLAAYVKKGEDGKYHVIPTVSSENWGFTVDFRLNKDCILDLALTEFVLDAVIEGSKTLGVDNEERSRWEEVRANLAPYPKARGPEGEVWLDVQNAPLEYVYNIPITLAPVFPGEQVGLGKGEGQLEIARRTADTVRLEGGNDLVYQPMIRARLGILDLGWFKREVRYCLMPNGAANDRVRQVGGRYDDSTDFDFMMRMGMWIENFALPAVLNECMLQSYTGTIRLFPNTRNLGPARFQGLRAVGAFLVSAAYDGQNTSGVSVYSEKGATLRLVNPWGKARVRGIRARDNQPVEVRNEGGIVTFPTQPGERYRLEP